MTLSPIMTDLHLTYVDANQSAQVTRCGKGGPETECDDFTPQKWLRRLHANVGKTKHEFLAFESYKGVFQIARKIYRIRTSKILIRHTIISLIIVIQKFKERNIGFKVIYTPDTYPFSSFRFKRFLRSINLVHKIPTYNYVRGTDGELKWERIRVYKPGLETIGATVIEMLRVILILEMSGVRLLIDYTLPWKPWSLENPELCTL